MDTTERSMLVMAGVVFAWIGFWVCLTLGFIWVVLSMVKYLFF